jgi:hypothetical protein
VATPTLGGLGQVGGGANPIAHVVGIGDLDQTLSERLEVSPSQAAVGGEALGEDEQASKRSKEREPA